MIGSFSLENLAPGILRRISPSLFEDQGGNINIPKKHIFEKRQYPKSYSKEILNSLILISNDPEGVVPFGSFIYKSQPYPADIDLMEPDVYVCSKKCSDKMADRNATRIFKKIVERIMRTPGVFLGDIKLGVDYELRDIVSYEDSGFGATIVKTLRTDRKTDSVKSLDYSPKRIRETLEEVVSKKWLSNEIAQKILTIINGKEDEFTKRCQMLEILRKQIVLRWTYDEIKRGYKILPGNRKYTMEFAFGGPDTTIAESEQFTESEAKVQRPGEEFHSLPLPLAKIDLWTLIGGRYIEVTNLMTFKYVSQGETKKYKPEVTYLTYGHDDFKNDLRIEIAKYFWNPMYDKPMKYAKRIYSLAKMLDDPEVGLKLVNLFHSDINRINMINSFLDMYVNMLQLLKNPPLKEIKKQIENNKTELAKIILFDWEENTTYEKIDKIASPSTSPKTMILLLEELHDYFGEIVRDKTRHYLKSQGLYPAQKKYLDRKHFGIIFS